jgi:pimeloyl-ACP methyl ester carboxylesterase
MPLPRSLAALVLLAAGCAAPLEMASPRTAATPRAAPSHTVVFIHGMYMTPACWDEWQKHFQDKGYRTFAPAWPEHDAPPEAQRKAHPNARLAALTLDQVVQRYADFVKTLDEPPILVGHSMGGLIVQLLLQRGLGAAGVAIDSAPPKGVISLKYSFLKSNWAVISPSARIEEPIALSFEDFQYAFVNDLPPAVQRAAYDRHVVPESRRVGKGPDTDAAKIEYARPRAPLLFVAGGEDHIIPAGLNRKNYGKYDATPSITDFREFPGRTHWTIAQDGWREVADYVLAWLARRP